MMQRSFKSTIAATPIIFVHGQRGEGESGTAERGFNCDERGSYNEPAANTARERSLEFFRKHIG
jgi:dienelactone hydrolase